ncbi:DUF742 domain-containing protein [Lipingzhangella sp. LS1_29]|uniref:DUF742 domain-containing protein n=1 Tax=Lipingzhangella rawalii TaxID=2055835 RepID=A0ABU2H7R7_9ACTN|nr:DUF742 domain-containing protein [Lipingzhangella rawalii]MDS1271349.1 DUF742 domain-containing protein [Lipingzhangella rawalii]
MTDPGPPPSPDDDDALVRPYVLTSGRQHASGAQLTMISVVVASTTEAAEPNSLEPEQLSILRLCHAPMSVAELAARLDLPVAVVKILVADLATRGQVHTRNPQENPARREMLEAVLDGIQRL